MGGLHVAAGSHWRLWVFQLARRGGERRGLVRAAHGDTFAPLAWGDFEGDPVLFPPRHGETHPISPPRIACRANSRVLADAGPGCRGVAQGPRFETAAGIRRMKGDGRDLVGMTVMRKAALARELGLFRVALCFVVNRAAGCSDGPVTTDENNANLVLCSGSVEALPRSLARPWMPSPGSWARDA